MRLWRQTGIAIWLALWVAPLWATQPCPMGMRSANWWWGGPVLAVTLLLVLVILTLAGFGWRRWRSLRARAVLVLATLVLLCGLAVIGLGAFVAVMLICY